MFVQPFLKERPRRATPREKIRERIASVCGLCFVWPDFSSQRQSSLYIDAP